MSSHNTAKLQSMYYYNPILQAKKLKNKEFKWLAQGHDPERLVFIPQENKDQ